MTKEQLIAAGLTEDQAVAALKLHTDAINGNYIPKHRFDEVNAKLKPLEDQVAERDAQISELKKFEGDSSQLTAKIKELQEANEVKAKEYESSFAIERKRNAVKLALLEHEAKPHDASMVMGLFNLDQIVVDENGNITGGFKEQQEAIQKEKAFLFSSVANTGATNTPPANQTGWKAKGSTPPEGSQGTEVTDASVSYGKSLAQIKLGMMGVKTDTTQQTQ